MEEKNNKDIESIVKKMTAAPEMVARKGGNMLKPSPTPRGRGARTSVGR